MFIILADATNSGQEATWTIGLVITTLLGLLSWYIKSAQERTERNHDKMRAALDDCTLAHIVVGLELAHLLPGAKERLEQLKQRVEQRLSADKEERK